MIAPYLKIIVSLRYTAGLFFLFFFFFQFDVFIARIRWMLSVFKYEKHLYLLMLNFPHSDRPCVLHTQKALRCVWTPGYLLNWTVQKMPQRKQIWKNTFFGRGPFDIILHIHLKQKKTKGLWFLVIDWFLKKIGAVILLFFFSNLFFLLTSEIRDTSHVYVVIGTRPNFPYLKYGG